MTTRPKVAVSGCLLGEAVRYDGGHCRSRFLTDELGRYTDLVSFCPELEIGLGSPRPAVRLVLGPTGERLVDARGTADHTDAMNALADRRIGELAGVDGWVFKARSPSCGLYGVARYGGERPVDRRGRGLFAARVTGALPRHAVEEEGRLNDAFLRGCFVERVFARARLRELFAPGWRPRDLVAFHSAHKLQVMAHDPEGYRVIGRVVARAGSRPPAELERDYTDALCAALAVPPSRGRHVNALQHAFGMLGDRLDDARRRDLVDVIEAYARGEVPLDVPLTLLRHDARGEDHAYLAVQTYFEPFPAGLVRR